MLQMFAEIHKELYDALPFVLNTVGENTKQPPVSRPRGFDVHHLIWVKAGEGSFCVNGEHRVLKAGQGVFMRADVPHSYQGENMHTQWVTFAMTDQVLDYLRMPFYLFFDVPPYLEHETDQLFAFATGNSTAVSRSSAGYTYVTELFSLLLSPKESIAQCVIRFLEHSYAEPLMLDDVAAAVGVDRFALCRAYKQERGITVMEELKMIRIAKAKRFLKYSADSVERIGKMCGFESASYFCKQFRETVGISPAEYRKQHAEK